MKPGDVVLRLLASIGRPREASFYLSQYRAERREQFAIIAAPPAVIRDQCEALAADLSLLARLELSPVVAVQSSEDLDRVAWAVDSAASATIQNAAQRASDGAIPIVHAPGPSLRALADTLQSHKVVLLDEHRGLELSTGEVPSLVDVATELTLLRGSIAADQKPLVDMAVALLSPPGRKLTVSITSPLNLLQELFTVRGAGTLLRNAAHVVAHDSYDAVDVERVRELMQSAFGKPVAAGFFDRAVDRVYIAGDYVGAALVAPTPLAPYLTKFAVGLRARGEGIGRDLWHALARNHERLLWRARKDNPVASWYEQQCDGMARTELWQVFWRGLSPAEIPAAIDLALAAPTDF